MTDPLRRSAALILLLLSAPLRAADFGSSKPVVPGISPVVPTLSAGQVPGTLPTAEITVVPGIGQTAVSAVPRLPEVSVPVTFTLTNQPENVPPAEITVIGGQGQAPTAISQIQDAAQALRRDGGEARLGSIIDGSKSAGGGSYETASVPAGADAQAEFSKAYPNHPGVPVLKDLGVPFEAFATQTMMHNVFHQTRDGERLIEEALGNFPSRRQMIDLANRIVDLAERDDEAGRRFASALGREQARQDFPNAMANRFHDGLPANPLPGGEYWDLAAGPNAMGHMAGQRDPKTTYVFFDRSAFVVSYLETGRQMLANAGVKMDNVKIVQVDLRKLGAPKTAPSVIRWKNVHTYVSGYEKRMEEIAGWLAPGGRLILENDPGVGQRITNLKLLGPIVNRMIAEGWAFDFQPLGRGDLETMTLTKPAAPLSAQARRDAHRASLRRWDAYARAVDEANQMDMMGGGLIWRLFGGR